MRIHFNKKIIISVTVLFILFGFLITNFYFNSHYRTFTGDRISFSYPKQILIEGPSTSRLYKQYRVRKGYVTGPNGSYIWIGEPIQNDTKAHTLSNDLRSEFVSLIQPVVINGIKGESATYHLDEQLPGDQPVKADITEIYLSSQYPNTPIQLYYSRGDADTSLDETWGLILKTLKY